MRTSVLYAYDPTYVNNYAHGHLNFDGLAGLSYFVLKATLLAEDRCC